MNQNENFTAPALYGFLSILVLFPPGSYFNIFAALDPCILRLLHFNRDNPLIAQLLGLLDPALCA